MDFGDCFLVNNFSYLVSLVFSFRQKASAIFAAQLCAVHVWSNVKVKAGIYPSPQMGIIYFTLIERRDATGARCDQSLTQ